VNLVKILCSKHYWASHDEIHRLAPFPFQFAEMQKPMTWSRVSGLRRHPSQLLHRIDNWARAASFLIMAAPAQHEAKILELEAEKARLLPSLDALIVQYQKQIPPEAATWMKREIERYIERNAAHVEKIGITGVKAMKEDFNNVINDLPSIAAQALADRAGWPHHQRHEPSRIGPREPFLDSIFRDLISTLGTVLERHGLMDTDRQYSSWEQLGGGKWRFRINPSIEPVLPDLRSRYSAGLHRLWQIERELESEKSKLVQVRAADLWDRA
jgi:hypothetical protein